MLSKADKAYYNVHQASTEFIVEQDTITRMKARESPEDMIEHVQNAMVIIGEKIDQLAQVTYSNQQYMQVLAQERLQEQTEGSQRKESLDASLSADTPDHDHHKEALNAYRM